MKKFFTSDPHLSHEGVIKMSDRPFSTIKEMDEIIINNMFDLPKGSDLYIGGDIAWNQAAAINLLNKKPKNIGLHLIIGNHDHRVGKTILKDPRWSSVEYQKVIKINEYHVTIMHHPMITWHRSYVPTSFQLYGHIHKNTPNFKPIGKQLNINLEFWDYKPISFEQVVEAMKEKPENWEIEEIRKRKIPIKVIYWRNGAQITENFNTVEEATSKAKTIFETDSGWVEKIIDNEGREYNGFR